MNLMYELNNINNFLLSKIVDGIEAFARFLKSEFSDENIKFWLAIEEFKKMDNKLEIETRAKWIYDTYVSRKAKTEVSYGLLQSISIVNY